MPERLLGPNSMWKVLVLGFGLILLLLVVTGVQVTQRMNAMQDEVAALNARYLRAQEAISTVRGQALLVSTYVRDARLDARDESTAGYDRQINDAIAEAEAAVSHYEAALPGDGELTRLQALDQLLRKLKAAANDALAHDRGPGELEARNDLREQVVVARNEVIRSSEDFQARNREGYVQQHMAMTERARQSQRGLAIQLGLALLASLAIGVLTARRAGRLERGLQDERAKAEGTAHELQRLSARLVSVEEDERRTIARELHDQVGQLLSAVKVDITLARRALEQTGQSRLLANAESMTDEALHGVRDLSRLLHPALLDDLGLPAAVDWYLQGFGRRSGLRVELLQEGMDQRLSVATEAGAYRIIQEALSNIARHARASLCRVYIQRLARSVLITVEDDGIGFDPAGTPSTGTPSGLGLIGIRERAWQLGGTVHIESAPGTGTRLTVELSARNRAADDTGPETETPTSSTEPSSALAPLSGPAPHRS